MSQDKPFRGHLCCEGRAYDFICALYGPTQLRALVLFFHLTAVAGKLPSCPRRVSTDCVLAGVQAQNAVSAGSRVIRMTFWCCLSYHGGTTGARASATN